MYFSTYSIFCKTFSKRFEKKTKMQGISTYTLFLQILYNGVPDGKYFPSGRSLFFFLRLALLSKHFSEESFHLFFVGFVFPEK